MRRPDGISERVFNTALDEFKQAVGREWVFTSDEDVGLYRDPYSANWGEADERVASAAVAPASTEEVQQVVRTANRLKIPLYAISTGKNLTYGGPAPNYSGSVVVDLKRMGAIEVDEKACAAIVEPGVSFFDFYRHTQERGLKVWANLPDPGWGGLIGNALDRGVGHTGGPWRDRFASVCGMEVVLPNGEVMRTGMGAVPNAKTWLSYPYGYGPHVAGLFSGANFGIVTKMGIWLYPEPEAYFRGTVTVPWRADLGPLIEIINYLEQSGLIGETVIRCPLTQLRNDPVYKAIAAKAGDWTDAEIDRLAEDHKLPSWAVDLQFYGPAKGIAGNWEYVKERFTATIKGALFEEGPTLRFPLTPEQIAQERKVDAFGIPSLSIFDMGRNVLPEPFDGHLDFSPVLPRTAEAVFEAQRVFAKAGKEIGAINVYTGGPVSDPFRTPQAWRARDFIFFISLATSRTDPKINARTRETFRHFVQVAAEHGWAEYRASPAFQDEVMAIYSFNNHALRRFGETLKDAIDPNGILSAGRGGIWPKHLRGKRS